MDLLIENLFVTFSWSLQVGGAEKATHNFISMIGKVDLRICFSQGLQGSNSEPSQLFSGVSSMDSRHAEKRPEQCLLQAHSLFNEPLINHSWRSNAILLHGKSIYLNSQSENT